MWEYALALTVNVPAERLWTVLECQHGSRSRLTIQEVSPPQRFAVLASLPLTRVETVHEFDPTERGTRVRVTIRYSGLLGAFWAYLTGARRCRRVCEQTRRLVQRAQGYPG